MYSHTDFMRKQLQYLFLTTALLAASQGRAQFLTREDSLNAGLQASTKAVILAGYGEAKVSYNATYGTGTASLTRNVLFVGYRFHPKVTFFSELEVENAKVAPGAGELAMEQCVLKFDLARNHYLLAGLFIPRIGFLNENHLPTTFNGNDRHHLETSLLPSTWREIGVGYYGSSNRVPGLNWSLGLMNGLNGAALTGGTGLAAARFEGSNATATNLAVTGSLLYFRGGLRLQSSAYYGGAVGLAGRVADSLGLTGGAFGSPVGLIEANAQYRQGGFTLKALAAAAAIPQAAALNAAYATNTPSRMLGFLGEASYNLLHRRADKGRQLNVFGRYEWMDLMAEVPENGIQDPQHRRSYIVAGLGYMPVRGVVLKADWKRMQTGIPNPALIFNPNPNAPAYLPTQHFFQLGMAYSF